MTILQKFSAVALLGLSLQALNAQAASVVQIPVQPLLNARPVTTISNGQLTTWNIGIDGNGLGNGYLTRAAAAKVGDKTVAALPNSSLLPATARHPAFQLHYNNKETKLNQARYLRDQDSFTLPVPNNHYAQLFLAFTSAEGATGINVELQYTDSTENIALTVPDYYADIAADDPTFFYLLHNLAKWDKANKLKEEDHHNIDGAELRPDKNKILTGVKITKLTKGYLVFWGATGVTAK